MNPEQTQEIWQVDANGQIFETDFAEMTSWIDQGTLLRGDKVRKGNLRWIEAGRVPSLIAVFNAKDNGQPIAPVITTTKLEPTQLAGRPQATLPTPGTNQRADSLQPPCSMHPDVPAVFVCGTCMNEFCRACPSSYGGNVKICPYCGAMCKPLAEASQAEYREVRIRSAISEGFGFGDFIKALSHPFRFKTSLVIGAVMYMLFTLGQSIVSVGGIFMMVSGLFCLLLANMLTVGILTNTVENFAQGRLDENFMPSFDDFSVWDDVVHPFFLSIGVYLASFGPFLAVALIAIFMMMGAVKTEMNAVQSDAARTASPGLPYAANAAQQSERVREILKRDADEQQKRVAAMDDPSGIPDQFPTRGSVADADMFNEDNFEEMNRMIGEQRKAQLESAIGKTPETVAKERSELLGSFLKYGTFFILMGGITFLWGLFYFPAACAVAGYTRSFMATMNPAVGLDTIRRLGGSYVLILVMGLLLVIASSIVGGVLGMILVPFDMPSVGNLPAKAIGSLFGFYLSVVFSCIIGYALFKASDRLQLAR